MPTIDRNTPVAKQMLCEVVGELKNRTLVKNLSDLTSVLSIMGITLSFDHIATEEQDCDFDADMMCFLNKLKLFKTLFETFKVVFGLNCAVTLTTLHELFSWFGENIVFFLERPVAIHFMETNVLFGASLLHELANLSSTHEGVKSLATKSIKTAQKRVMNFLVAQADAGTFKRLSKKIAEVRAPPAIKDTTKDMATSVYGLTMNGFTLHIED